MDEFSKYAWAIMVNSEDAKAITAAFEKLFTAANSRHSRRLQTNKGKNVFNSNFKAMIKRHGIQHIASESEQMAAVVERFNRTIKTKIETLLSDHVTVRWVDVNRNLVDVYNHAHNRSIGIAAADVRTKDKNHFWVRLVGNGGTYLKPKIQEEVIVRANNQKTIFDKGYMPNLTKEHFTVSQ